MPLLCTAGCPLESDRFPLRYSTNGPLGGTPASTGGAAHADTPGLAEAAQATSGGAAAVRPAEERGGAE